ncbi:ComF family protein [Salimicrobium halophilum]|uniref:Competence protein ComFC n=1 Tax=Salimicrobium halophilum TaxID=86666 RepID=A0A1G8S110_9BACI|nr:ComF family protein [Salimicrobium halophilum]SDJ22485.1 competence protein ComFC [Salimicrobium halophilum]
MRCLYCFDIIQPKTDWTNVLMAERDSHLCVDCQQGFRKIEQGCPKCCNPRYTTTCPDCRKDSSLESNISFLHYNDFAKDWVARWKYRGDYELIKSMHAYLPFFIKGKAVPVPLSEERLEERGFNQAEAILHILGKKPHNLLGRTHAEKQSKKTKREREQEPNPFYVKRPVKGNVLLIDDIYTTGTTMKKAAQILKENGATSVKGLTLFRS